jgi:DUF1680 family protein
MLLITGEAKYADVMERALYNGVLAGMSLSGTEYTYQNHIGSKLSLKLPHGQHATIVQRTRYPWEDKVELQISAVCPQTFELSLRIPGWCRGAKVGVNTEAMQEIAHGGRYVVLQRAWKDGDVITLVLPQPVRLEQSHPHTSNTGRVAVCRGPLVYCIEAEDYPDADVFDVALTRASRLQASFQPGLLGGVVTIAGKARTIDRKPWNGRLYLPLGEGDSLSDGTVPFQAIPYFAWANRSIGKMQTWIHLYHSDQEV